VLAEDSSQIRAGIEGVFKGFGYLALKSLADGEDCYYQILELKEKAGIADELISNYLNLLITDIEMPKMDGLYSVQPIFFSSRLQTFSASWRASLICAGVILFSSDFRTRCASV